MQIQFGAKSYLERNVYWDMLEDSRLQIMRLGGSTQTTVFPSTFQFNSQYLARNLNLKMLEDSQLQIMRLGESNIRHLEDSVLQILGFRCFTMDISRDCRSNKMP